MVAFEALVVGIINAVVYLTLDKLNSGVSTKWLLVFTGALIHFLFEFKNYREIGFDSKSAIEKIITTTFPALLMTTILICIGFGAFIFGNYVPNVKFGVSVAIVLFIALLADFIVLPAILLFYKKK